MLVKRIVFFLLFTLLVFFTTSRPSLHSIGGISSTDINFFSVSEKYVDSEEQNSVSSVKQPTDFILKGNESNFSGFQNFKNNRKILSANLAVLSIRTFTVFYSAYSLSRINSNNESPFYITYHRLTI
jgi:hypothetical protein